MSILLRYRVALITFSMLVGLCLTSNLIEADQVGLSVSASSSAYTNGVSDDHEFGLSLVQSTINVPNLVALANYNNSDFDMAASSSLSGTVAFGTITGAVAASASESTTRYPLGTPLGDTNANATFKGFWQDSILVTSTTLGPGAPVDLLFTLSTNAALACYGGGGGYAYSGIQAGSSVLSFSNNNICSGSTFGGSETMTVVTAVGSDLQIEGQLDIEAAAAAVNGIPGAASIDPPTSTFYIDSLTSGASYTTGSGNTYFTPNITAPEPSSCLLLCSGLFGFLGVIRRKKNK